MAVMTAAQTAELLGYSYNYFQYLKKNKPNTIPPSVKISPRKEIWLKESVYRFLEEKEASQNQI